MRTKVDNVFTYYRGPSSREKQKQQGKQLEDNATAALLKTLNEVDRNNPEAANKIIQTLVGDSFSIPDETRITCDDQVDVTDIPTSKQDILLIGLSPSGLDLAEIDESETQDNGGIVDGVIKINNNITLVLEVKTQNGELTNNELEKYAKELEIELAEYNRVTWADLAETLSNLQSSGYHPVTNFLFSELYEFIEMTTLNRTVAAAHWREDGGYNYKQLTMRYRDSMNRRTNEADNEEVPPFVHLEFNADGYKPISFSVSEWQAAVKQFPEEIQEGFVRGDYTPFIELMKTNGRTTLAKVGEDDGVRKIIEVNPDKERICIQSKTSEYNSHYRNRPTLHESDFNELYRSDTVANRGPLPSITPNGKMAKALFRDGDLLQASPFNIGPENL